VGTSTLTYETGLINIRRVEKLVKVLSDLQNSGREVILVTSGAIGVGCGRAGLQQRPSDIPTRQAMAAVGQCELMRVYSELFAGYNHTVAQVLLTRDVVENGHRRDNAANTFRRLLSLGIIPVINENDTVSTDELAGDNIGDNDTLSAIVAELTGADVLVIMSDIEGLYDANPNTNPAAKLIPVVERVDSHIREIASGTSSNRGTGGMTTKIHAAEIATSHGADMAIVSGTDPDNLYRLFDGEAVGTHFKATNK
jgi:glutamate 5-kinase